MVFIKMGAQKAQSFSSGMNGQKFKCKILQYRISLKSDVPSPGGWPHNKYSPCVNEMHGMGEP